MRYVIRSTGAWGDLDDVRYDEADRLAYALAIFGAEATLRCAGGMGSVILYDVRGRELLACHGDRLAVRGGPFLEV